MKFEADIESETRPGIVVYIQQGRGTTRCSNSILNLEETDHHGGTKVIQAAKVSQEVEERVQELSAPQDQGRSRPDTFADTQC